MFSNWPIIEDALYIIMFLACFVAYSHVQIFIFAGIYTAFMTVEEVYIQCILDYRPIAEHNFPEKCADNNLGL